VHRHLRENTPLVASFHWKLVLIGYDTLALEAQDPDVHLQVQLTQDLARRCLLIQPADVEWCRWRAAGWDVCLDLAPAIKATKAEIVFDPPADPFVEFAPKGLRSIVFNLLSNALKYHYPGRVPRIVVRSTCHKGHLRLLVQNNGLGLTPT